ncbi:MAG: AAA family ATPase [Solirubrobacterales bacterium]
MSPEPTPRFRFRRRDGKGWGVAVDHLNLDQTADLRFRHRLTKGYGVVAESPQSISGWWGDQPWAGPHPTSTASDDASTEGGNQTPPSGTLADLKDKLTRRGRTPNAPAEVEWLDLDFDSPPEPPRYIVGGLFERGTVNIVSSDTGAGKTWVSLSLVAAALAETDWLGRLVEARRIVVVDEENPAAVILGRLRALGVTNEQVPALRYSSRQGVALGDPDWNRWLLEQAIEHDADLILVDTAMAATNVEDVNNNSEAVVIYRGLRAIAEEADLAVVLFHHHRKSQAGQPRGGGQAMMGGRQWAGQADTHVTLSKKAGDRGEPSVDGHTAFEVELRVEKRRNGIEPPPEEIQISAQNEDGCLLTASVVSLGAVTREPSKAEVLALKMREALAESGPLKIGTLAEQLDEDKSSGTWERAREYGLEAGLLVKSGYGIYEAGSEVPRI